MYILHRLWYFILNSSSNLGAWLISNLNSMATKWTFYLEMCRHWSLVPQKIYCYTMLQIECVLFAYVFIFNRFNRLTKMMWEPLFLKVFSSYVCQMFWVTPAHTMQTCYMYIKTKHSIHFWENSSLEFFILAIIKMAPFVHFVWFKFLT